MVRCGRCREVFNASWNLIEPPAEKEQSTATKNRAWQDVEEEPVGNEQTPPAAGTTPAPKESDKEQTPPVADTAPALKGSDNEPDEATDEEPLGETPTEERPLVNDGSAESLGPLTTEELDFLDNRLESTDGLSLGDPGDSSLYVARADREPEKTATGAEAEATDQEEPKPETKPVPEALSASATKTEEIVIEAPSTLWDLETDSKESSEAGTPPIGPEAVPPKPSIRPKVPRSDATDKVADASTADRAPPRQSGSGPPTTVNLASDVRMVEIPYPQPIKTAAWALGALFLVLGIVWQVREFYLPDLATVPTLRGPLTHFCDYVSCTVPPRRDLKSIDLVGTSVDPHPVTPGALRVSANLVNRARFDQAFPPLEVTLTDKEGNIVGRRTYMPHEYRRELHAKMTPNVIERADFDLARPAESAVGYEIQLVAR